MLGEIISPNSPNLKAKPKQQDEHEQQQDQPQVDLRDREWVVNLEDARWTRVGTREWA